jgi:acetyl-CoA carboxylase biotin carboxylase subunit
MTQIRRLLVANRGEIAVRIIRACERLGIEPVVVYSDADRDSLAVRMASRAVCIGPPPAARSYLSMNTILHAAIATACDAIHPGYGFLSERAEFASRCADEKLLFVGPSPEAIGVMGNKLAARKAAIEAGIPVLAGSMKISTADEARRLAADIGYPVLLKAAAGGGGRGMKIVRGELELDRALQAASAGAQAAFGDGTLYMERYIGNARHPPPQGRPTPPPRTYCSAAEGRAANPSPCARPANVRAYVRDIAGSGRALAHQIWP